MERKTKSAFNLKSGNNPAFKYMGSSPIKERLTNLDIMSKEEEVVEAPKEEKDPGSEILDLVASQDKAIDYASDYLKEQGGELGSGITPEDIA